MLTDKILLRYTDYECRELSTIAGHTFQNECPSLHLGSLRKPAYIINYFICLFFYNSSIRLRTKTRQIAIKPLYSSDK